MVYSRPAKQQVQYNHLALFQHQKRTICCFVVINTNRNWQTDSIYTVFKKNRTPKAGRHKSIKISSPKMIFHTVHCHSVADSLCLKSLVWVEYQLHGFHGNKSRGQLYVNKQNDFDERGTINSRIPA